RREHGRHADLAHRDPHGSHGRCPPPRWTSPSAHRAAAGLDPPAPEPRAQRRTMRLRAERRAPANVDDHREPSCCSNRTYVRITGEWQHCTHDGRPYRTPGRPFARAPLVQPAARPAPTPASAPAGGPTSCTPSGRPSSPWKRGTEIAGWPEALKTGVKGVNRPERVKVAIGSGAAVSSVPRGSGRSASAGVSSTS